MSLPSAVIRLLVEKGLSALDIVEVIEAVESARLKNAVRNPVRKSGKLRKISPHGRLSSGWRKKAFERIADRDGLICAHCFEPEDKMVRRMGVSGEFLRGNLRTRIAITSNLELDHCKPLCEGGSNDDENLRLVCHTCHKIKSAIERTKRSIRGAGMVQ